MLVETLADYIESWKTPRGRERIVSLSSPWLLETGAHQAALSPPLMSRGEFRTGEIDLDAVRAQHLQRHQRQVFPLQKRAQNPFASVISVGRTLNLDIPLPRPGISKLHAHFSEQSPGHFGVTDRDSRNGTFVGGERITPHVWTALEDGEEVRFATFAFRFVSSSTLVRLLEGIANERE